MDVKILPALEDNYMYLLIDKTTKEAAIVDPVEPQKVLDAVDNLGVYLKKALVTHHHWDHAGGNEGIKQIFPQIEIYGGDDRIGSLTHMVGDKDCLKIGNLMIHCLATPCHTSGHVCYYVTSCSEGDGVQPVVFTGDTLFLGGCGRFFEGNAQQMYKALCEVLSSLPESTKVYCGHEYTTQNLQFAALVEPQNIEITKKASWSLNRRQAGLPTVPSTIGEEKSYNPFMRVSEKAVKAFAGTQDVIDTMRMIRLKKDNFKSY